MNHSDLLKLLLPPTSLDPNGTNLALELAAEGHALDLAQGTADQILDEADPRTTAATLADWERVYGLPEPFLPVRTQALGPGVYANTVADIASFSRASAATYIGEDGLLHTAPVDTPRFDYDPVTHRLRGLLLEDRQDNLLAYSEQFDAGAWIKSGTSVVANCFAAPTGAQTADKLVENSASAYHYAYSGFVVGSGVPICFSCFVRAAGRTAVVLELGDSTSTSRCFLTFNFENGTTNGLTVLGGAAFLGSLIKAFENGWYRLSIAANIGAYTAAKAQIALVNGAGATLYVGDGVSGIYLGGAQAEPGLFPSSYILAEGAPATRAADACALYQPLTTQERRAALVAKVILQGGQSPGFFVDLALTLGYVITITECTPTTTEFDSEHPTYDEQYRFVWFVNAALNTVRDLTTEDDTEMATAIWDNGLLEAVIKRYKPAHTLALFAYS